MKLNIGLFINNSFRQIKSGLFSFPVEILLCLVAGVFLAWHFDTITNRVVYVFAMSVPTVLSLNRLLADKGNRTGYLIASILFIFFYSLIPWEKWMETNGRGIYFKALLTIAWSFFFFAGQEKENVVFSKNILRFFVSIFLAGVYTGVLAGLFELIYYSCHLLFGISYDAVTWGCRIYIWLFLVFPQVFLAYYGNKNFKTTWLHRIITMLFTPAALIYTCILYLYFFQIILSASFPEGMLSYMVGWYMGITIFLQMNYLLSDRKNRLYDWFYDKLPYLFIFPLIMYGLSVYKRIEAYGFTEDRYLLIIIGLVYLMYILFFVFARTRKYILLFPVIILSMVMGIFTPYINAYSFSISSQTKRVEQVLAKYRMLDEEGYLKEKNTIPPIPYEDYESFFSSLNYLENKGIKISDMKPFSGLNSKGKHFSSYTLRSFISVDKPGAGYENRIYKSLSAPSLVYEPEGYDFLLLHTAGSSLNVDNLIIVTKPGSQRSNRDSLKVFRKVNGEEIALAAYDLPVEFTNKFKQLNIDPEKVKLPSLSEDEVKTLFTLQGDGYKIVFSKLEYSVLPGTMEIELSHYSIKAIFAKKIPLP